MRQAISRGEPMTKPGRSFHASILTCHNLCYSAVVHCKICFDIWSAEVFASARASAETDALQMTAESIFYSQNKFNSVLLNGHCISSSR